VSGRPASPLPGSERARRHAAAIVSVLSGESTTARACEMMEVSLPRYYQLETRALLGMVAALEPRAKGGRTPEKEIEAVRKENARLAREVSRLQSLVRMSHRALGGPAGKKEKGSKPTRKPKRGRRAIARLVRPGEDGPRKVAEAGG
jgi:hypothetical protein